jgi:hypothetical protein
MPVPVAATSKAVAANIRRFQDEVAQSPALQGRLPYARAWYAVRDRGRWLFGPSKFVGYDGFTAARYLKESKAHDGRATEAHLRRWFTKIDDGSPLDQALRPALNRFLGRYGKAPSVATRINVLSIELDGSGAADSDALVGLLVAVARELDAARLGRLKSRVAAL